MIFFLPHNEDLHYCLELNVGGGKFDIAGIRLLRWMNGDRRHDRIRNTIIGQKVGVALFAEKMVKSCFRWFGRMEKRLDC